MRSQMKTITNTVFTSLRKNFRLILIPTVSQIKNDYFRIRLHLIKSTLIITMIIRTFLVS